MNCCVHGCKRKEKRKHALPLDDNLFVKWCKIIKREDLLDLVAFPKKKRYNYRVCDEHFDEDAKFITHRNRTNLKKTALPSLFLPAQTKTTGNKRSEIDINDHTMKKFLILFSITFLITCSLCDELEENVEETEKIDKSKYFRAQVESCPGCSLNRLKDVKTFVYDDVPKYDRVTFKKINGAPPELVFFDKDDNVVERVDLRSLNREQCNYELLKRGFLLKLAARSPLNRDEL